jgi:DME family drug/metabolite transporter
VVATVTLTSGTAPVFAAVGGTLFFGRRPTAVWWAATAVTVVGCVLVTTGGGGAFRVDPLGALMAVGAGLSYATYAAAASRSAQLGGAASLREQVGSTCRVLGVGAVVLLPVWVPEVGLLGGVPALLGAVWLGVVGTGAAYALFRVGARTVPVATATSLSMVDAATGAVLGVLVVGEPITPQTVVGVVAVLLGATALQLALARAGTDRTVRDDAAAPFVDR